MSVLTTKQQAAAQYRLEHINSCLNGETFNLEKLREYSNRNLRGEYVGMFSMAGYTECKAMIAWFCDGDVDAVKNWFYNRAKLIYIQENPPFESDYKNLPKPRMAFFDGLFFLMADHPQLLEWYTQLDQHFDPTKVESIKDLGFYTKQFFLALRGEMDVLGERAERLLADPPKSAPLKNYLIDHQFFLALAKGDMAGMEAAISELLTPRKIASRSDFENGYTDGLICTPAIIYSKLAWRHGYEVDIDSPYVPQAWLPTKPLAQYENAWEFMNKYTFEGEPTIIMASNQTTSTKKSWQFWK